MSDPITRLNAALEGRYAIERELGEGGMARVYLADDLRHERRVAIKVLKPEIASAVGLERFLAEIKTTANLQHPHILPLHDSGEADGLLFYVTPYVEGESLAQQLEREHQLPIDDAVRITTDIAEALDYAHEQGVIHRDIKPGNILIHSGRPVIADFGIALAMAAAGGRRITETGLSVGTPCYMSPEQAMGDQNVGAPADTYSLACVLYEMLVGEPPFMGTTAQAILGRIVTGEAPSTMAQRKAVPPNVDAAIAKALEKVPADRFKSAGAFAEALGDPGFRHGAEPVSPVTDTIPWRSVSLAATVLLIAMSVVAVKGWLQPRPTEDVTRYVLGQSEQEALVPDFGSSIALSPDGLRLAYVGQGEEDVALWVKERDEAHARRVPGTDGAQQPFFFPDGDRVGFIGRDPSSDSLSVRVVSLENGTVVTLASGVQIGGGSAGPDGSVYVMRRQRTIARLPGSADSLETVTEVQPGEMGHVNPDFLPGGRGVLFTVVSDSSWRLEGAATAVVDLETGEHRVLVEDAVYARYAATGHLLYVRFDGTLMAAPFDETELRLTGEAVPLLGGVFVGNFQGSTYGVDLALSESGTLVYTTREAVDEGSRRLQWVTRAGLAQTIDPAWSAEFESVSLSPDGARLAVTVGDVLETDVWIKELDQGPHTPLTFTEGMNRRPIWMPGGSTLSYITDRGENRDVFAKRADGLGSAEALFDLDVHVDEAVWSNDGAWLVYRTGISEGDRDIYAWRAGSDPEAAITVSALPGVDEVAPTLSPDGRFLAYVSWERGNQAEIWVRTFPDVNAGRWQISTEGGTEPLWAPNGRELFYVSSEGLVAVPVETNPTFSRGEETLLFPLDPYWGTEVYRGYDVTADGQRFVMIRNADAELGAEIIVVENFFEELRARVRN